MLAAWEEHASIIMTAKVAKVGIDTARRYINEGDPNRGLVPLRDYTAIQARKEREKRAENRLAALKGHHQIAGNLFARFAKALQGTEIVIRGDVQPNGTRVIDERAAASVLGSLRDTLRYGEESTRALAGDADPAILQVTNAVQINNSAERTVTHHDLTEFAVTHQKQEENVNPAYHRAADNTESHQDGDSEQSLRRGMQTIDDEDDEPLILSD